MKNQATIRDLAIRLDISISTVSRALRNAPDVNRETKRAVLAMAKQLNYEPNRVAQSLRIRKTNTLGVVVPEINLHFFSASISGIQEYAAQHKYSIMICQSMESESTEQSNIHMLMSNRVDGLLISLSSQTKNFQHLEHLIEKHFPIILFDRIAEDLPVSKVVVDDRQGAFNAVEHLIRTQCRRIAFLGGPKDLYITNQRFLGYCDALKQNNLPVKDELICHFKNLQSDPAEVLHEMLGRDNKPDAFLCINDGMAIRVLQVLQEKNIDIPGEVSVVGFTNEPVSKFIVPSLTTVSQPAYEMGQMAAKLFIQQMNPEEDHKIVTAVLPTELIIRNSTRRLK